MLRKIQIAFVVALVGYILVYFGISNYVTSTVSTGSISDCGLDLSCIQAGMARTLATDITLYSVIGAVVLGVLAWMIVPEPKQRAVSRPKTVSPSAQPKQNEKNVAQPGLKCPRCGADNGAASKFCVECGQSMLPPPPPKKECPHCGVGNVAANKFCVECGQSMLPPPPAKKECPHCGVSNDAAYKFCVECGQSMLLPSPAKKQCPQCGVINEPAYSFCTDCGTPLSAQHLELEPQTADGSGSTSDIPSVAQVAE